MPKNTPSTSLVDSARVMLSQAIVQDAIEAEGPFYERNLLRPDHKPIWGPRPETLKWSWNQKQDAFAFTMQSTEVQVNAYWAEGMEKGYIAHNGQQRNIAYNSILKGTGDTWHVA